MLALGIIGLGGVSRFYLEAAERAAQVEAVAVCDLDPARLAPFLNREGLQAYREPAALLEDERVQAVVLDTPVATHVDLARAALGAGRHVCCEKPLALTVAEARELSELAAGRDRVLFTAFHRRYNRNLPEPGSLDLNGLELVELRYLERIEEHTNGDMSWYATPASEGGGCIVDNGPNAVDVVRHLFGEVTVDAVHVERSPEGVDLRAAVTGRAGGAPATIRLDWAYAGEVKDLLVRWSDGRELHADMLGGFAEFKSSLHHEYDAVLADFAARVSEGRQDPDGLAATAWLEQVLAAR